MPQKTCADSASLDAMESASWHRKPSKSKRSETQCALHLALISSHDWAPVRWLRLSTVNYQSLWGRCQSMQAFTPLAELESPYRCNRTIRSWKERSGSSTCLIGLAVHEYHLTCVHIHILMNNEFSTLVQSPYTQNSNNKSDSCPRTRLRISPVTRLQSHKDPEGSRRRSYRQIRATPLVQ